MTHIVWLIVCAVWYLACGSQNTWFSLHVCWKCHRFWCSFASDNLASKIPYFLHRRIFRAVSKIAVCVMINNWNWPNFSMINWITKHKTDFAVFSLGEKYPGTIFPSNKNTVIVPTWEFSFNSHLHAFCSSPVLDPEIWTYIQDQT